MKIKGLLIGMLACTALVGCNNEDVVNNDVKNGEEYYAVVSFSMPGNTSRAASLGDFEDASIPEEIEVYNAMFYFLDNAGKSVADACYVANAGDFTWSTDVQNPENDNVNALTNSVIVMKNPTDIPSRIVALINVGNLKLSTNRPSLEQLQSVVGSYATDTHTAIPTDGMVMSSTSYLDATGAVTIGAPVSANNIFESEEELKKEVGDLAEGAMADVAVVIPVEKVLAKVTVAQGANFVQDVETTTLGSLTDAGTSGNAATATTNDVKLSVEINGWWLDSTPTHSYLLKDINNVNVGNWWNDLANTRSYWANSYEGDNPAQGYANDQYDETQAAIGNSLYTQENTSMPIDKPEQGDDGDDNVYDGNNRTKVVVAATLKNGNSAVSLVKWYGNYYTEEGFLISLANLNDVKKYYIKTTSDAGDTYTSLTKDNLQIVANTDKGDAGTEIGADNQNNVVVNGEEIRNYEAAVKLTDDVTALYVVNSNGEFEAVKSLDAVNTELLNISKIQYWKDGKTYYYVEIEHNYDSETQTTYYGVVRNHLYKLTLDGVKGLGTPVPNPDKIIIPEKPADTYSETYISANIQILAYKVVSNNVTLE